MSVRDDFDLFALLPEYLKLADREHSADPATGPGPLEALMLAAQTQADLVYADILHLLDNMFVETCEPWVLPYIARLIGLDVSGSTAHDARREVARTMAYRRRSGTVAAIEAIAQDTTGCDARAVEFFDRLVWHQDAIHLRPLPLGTVDLRDRATLRRIDGPWDRSAHTVDLRPSSQRAGLHAIRKLGIYLWRTAVYQLRGVEAHEVTHATPGFPPLVAQCAYQTDVLSRPLPLFDAPSEMQRPTGEPWMRVREGQVAEPIAPDRFDPAAIEVRVAGVVRAPVVVADLCDWTRLPPPGTVFADPELGRITFHPADAPPSGTVVQTTTYTGARGPLGGGGYPRNDTLPLRDGETADVRYVVTDVPRPQDFTTLEAAVAAFDPLARVHVVTIRDSRTYRPGTLPLPATFDTVILRAASGERPTIVLDAIAPLLPDVQGTTLILRGLLITRSPDTPLTALTIPPRIAHVSIEDCTVDPGYGRDETYVAPRPPGPPIVWSGNGVGGRLDIVRSIAGRLDLPAELDCLHVADSILDAPHVLADGPPATVERSTLFGTFEPYRLEAGEAIFAARVTVARRQVGCVRYCSFVPGSTTPRRYRCAPDTDTVRFVSRNVGEPGYAALALDTPASIASSGPDGGEMGAWASLRFPQRLTRLRAVLRDHLPAGIVPAIVYGS